MTRSHLSPVALPETRPLPPFARVLARLAETVARWQQRRKTRRALGHLDPHLMKDIGLTRLSRDAECGKPFWRD